MEGGGKRRKLQVQAHQCSVRQDNEICRERCRDFRKLRKRVPVCRWVCVPFVLRGRDVRRFSVIVHSWGMICSIWVWINSFQVWIPPHLVWNPTCLVWNYTILWYETPLNRYEIEGVVWLHTVVWNLKYMVWNSTHGMKLQLWYETGMKVKIVWNHTRVWNTDIMVWNEY